MKIPRPWRAVALALLFPFAPLAAQESPAEKPKDEPAEQPGDEAKGAPPASVSADGFVIQSRDGDYRLRVGAYVQADGRFYPGDEAKLGTDTFLLRRARVLVAGTVAERFEVYLVPDFGGGQAVIQDAYLDARFSSAFRVRIGKFKAASALEQGRSDSNLFFVERGLPSAIAPSRDVGVQIHGEVRDGIFSYALALQNGVVDGSNGDSDVNDGKDTAARAFVQPFKGRKGPLQGLGFGVAGQIGRQEGIALPTYRSPGQLAMFSYAAGVSLSGTRKRWSPHAHYYVGPFAVFVEYALSSTPLVKGEAAERVSVDAWQVAASLLLTKDKTGWTSPVKPARPFDPGKKQWGALELVARVHRLNVGDEAFAIGFADITRSVRSATAWAIGLNWYLNRNIKYVLNYEQTSFGGGAATGDRPREKAILARAQVYF
jgi:phosphate-selective porin OprO/OprP